MPTENTTVQAEKPVKMPIPPRIVEKLREARRETGTTQQRILEDSLDFAFSPSNKRRWM
jgi:hypothetical protein